MASPVPEIRGMRTQTIDNEAVMMRGEYITRGELSLLMHQSSPSCSPQCSSSKLRNSSLSASWLSALSTLQGCHTERYDKFVGKYSSNEATPSWTPDKDPANISEFNYLLLSGAISQSTNLHSTIVRGLLRSHKFLDLAGDIPCDIVQTLESDADAAENFVSQLVQGQVPDLIKDLPEEIQGAFSDVLNIAETLPTEILGAAEAIVTDAANLFNDIENGNIVSDLEQIPGIVVSDITAGWGDFTSGLVDAWDEATDGIACFFGDCPTSVPSAGSCAAATTVASYISSAYPSYVPATTTVAVPASTLQPTQQPSTLNAQPTQQNAFPAVSSANPTSLTVQTTPTSIQISSTSATSVPAGNSAAPSQFSSDGSGTRLGSIQLVLVAILGTVGFLFSLL